MMKTQFLSVAASCVLAIACGASDTDSSGSNAPGPSGGDPAGASGSNSGSPTATGTQQGSQQGSGAGGNTTEPYESGPPHVQFIGRFDTSDPTQPRCAFAGCRIVARFNGTQVRATMRDDDPDWMEASPSEWDVSIDGVLGAKLVMAATDTVFELASSLAPGDHIVELYKRSEPQTGTTRFLGFDFAGGSLLPPPKRSSRRIEIIGDSSSAGFGIEGVNVAVNGDCPGLDHAAKWENFHKAYGAVLGESLGAEVFGTVLSGKGIVKNIWHPDKETIPMLFVRTLPFDSTTAWNFAEWQPDVVIFMAGGNDFAVGKPVDEGPATLEEFTSGYRDFVATVRSKYPQAHLVVTVSPTVDDSQPPDRETRTNVAAGVDAVVAERNAQGDAKTWMFAPTTAVPSEVTACLGHGNEAFHQRVAAELAAFIKPKLGW